MDGFWLFIGLYNIFSRLPLGNAQIHSLLLDIPVRLRLRHVQAFDEEPFRPIHQADLTDLFLHGGLLQYVLRQLASRPA